MRGAILNNKDDMTMETKEIKSSKGTGERSACWVQRTGEISIRILSSLRPRHKGILAMPDPQGKDGIR